MAKYNTFHHARRAAETNHARAGSHATRELRFGPELKRAVSGWLDLQQIPKTEFWASMLQDEWVRVTEPNFLLLQNLARVLGHRGSLGEIRLT